ncbi:uncharacterized protein SPSK_03306 [Sporothrix schenckii 1099-18]|uniref:F-box domain-containing protein n=1 Tax=Sporothrix schenckii 1099-18 TaxID=1397361 RepID=A0A0F2M037_SPOSC|nr:uncharacterized protein SPSK_03306 [Sporothrix schenckii 1099-18]KJR82125.1 hypothetical protein SPSK_03306 [Sporothrix schenckii 1099-18]
MGKWNSLFGKRQLQSTPHVEPDSSGKTQASTKHTPGKDKSQENKAVTSPPGPTPRRPAERSRANQAVSTTRTPPSLYAYTPLPSPPNDEYLAPTGHDDENVPLGRLRALCPHGPYQEQPAQKVITTLLTKYATATKATKATWKARTASTHHAKKRPTRFLGNIAVVSRHNDIDVLAARGLYNAACSPLVRLPDDVIARIMGYLDWDDLYFLRHTSRVFMRLFSCRDEFASLRDVNAISNNTSLYVLPTPWTLPAFPTDDFGAWSTLRQRGHLAEDMCGGCKAYGQFRYYDMFMHCTACEADHPMSLFSGKMIRRDDKAIMENRVCQAHEGHVRLCQHKTVDWDTVIKSLPNGRLDNNFRDDCWANQLSSAEVDNTAFSVDAHLRIVCDHPSHAKHPHHTGEADDRVQGQGEADHTQLPSYERFTTKDHGESPSFVVHDMMVDGVRHKVITWSYTAHLNLADADDSRHNGAITAQAFRDRVHELHKGHSPARYIAPPDYPGILPELRCVDPERCG